MIIYNVTVKVTPQIHEEWVKWMKEVHIPAVMATKHFEKFYFSRIISHQDNEGFTYSVQYHSISMGVVHQYQIKHAPQLQKEHVEKFGEQALAFRTLMEILD